VGGHEEKRSKFRGQGIRSGCTRAYSSRVKGRIWGRGEAEKDAKMSKGQNHSEGGGSGDHTAVPRRQGAGERHKS